MQHPLHGEHNNQDGTAETHDQSVSDRFGNASQQASRWANQSFYIDVFTVQEDGLCHPLLREGGRSSHCSNRIATCQHPTVSRRSRHH